MAKRVTLGVLMLVLAAIATALSIGAGVPSRLPGAALGSEALLYAERGAALFAVLVLAAVVIIRAIEGDLPTELSGRGMSWTPREVTAEVQESTAAGLEELREVVEHLRDATVETFEDVYERLDALPPQE